MKVWIVVHECGEYSEWTSVNVGAFSSREVAVRFIESLELTYGLSDSVSWAFEVNPEKPSGFKKFVTAKPATTDGVTWMPRRVDGGSVNDCEDNVWRIEEFDLDACLAQ
jgi:hypothetical protein